MTLRTRIHRAVIAVVASCLAVGAAAAPGSSAASPRQSPPIAIVGVTVIPMDSERRLPDRTVLVENGRIVAIGARADVEVPRGARRIDGIGRYLIPGLADMHAHVVSQDDLTMHLAHGVTTVRVLWGERPVLDLREAVRAGRIDAPRMIVGSRIFDGAPPIQFGSYSVTAAQDAPALVRAIKADGYDFVKIYSMLSPPVYDAVIAAGKAEGIPIAGHLPTAVPLAHALESGQRSIEHMGGMLRATVRDATTPDLEAWFAPAATAAFVALGKGEATIDQYFDPARLAAVSREVARSDTWTVPTLAVLRAFLDAADAREIEARRPERRYAAPALRRFWDDLRTVYLRAPADQERGRVALLGYFDTGVRALHEAGAKLLIGTDTPNPDLVAGVSVHDELGYFVRAGVPAYAALRAATVEPARYLGDEGVAGTISLGARADLLLLDADPLADIANTRRIAGVVSEGRWFARDELDRRKQAIAVKWERIERQFDAAPAIVRGGETAPVSTAAYRALDGERQIGATRYALVPLADGAARLRVQSFAAPQGAARTMEHDVELGADGRARAWRVSRPDGRTLSFVRSDDGRWGAVGAGAAAVACDSIVTGTVADVIVLKPVLDAMKEGDERRLSTCAVGADGVLTAVDTRVQRRARETRVFREILLIGAYPFDFVDDAGGRRTLWLGGGFYTGAPMQMDERRPDGSTVTTKAYL